MNSLFLSPAFPPNASRFCAALDARGATVLGVGDVPPADLGADVASVLTEYVFVPRMGDFEILRASVGDLVARHGRIDHLDSHGEHWLEIEARLRDDLEVPGLGTADLARMRSKRAMAEVFASVGILHPPGIPGDAPERVRALAREHGYPLVFKPDIGSGAADTFPVADAGELDAALDRALPGYVVQPFVAGPIVTFDGIVDLSGEVVFCTSHTYDTGIMEVRRGRLDGHYYSLRVVKPALEDVGRRALRAFDVRGRFFHFEFFDTPRGYVALELNVRAPGGFTTDMMNDACDIDVYDLWAAAVIGAEDLGGFRYERKFHTAHAGRRRDRAYRIPDAALAQALGSTLVSRRTVPEAFAVTMGDTAYLLRHPDLEDLRAAIALVQEPAR